MQYESHIRCAICDKDLRLKVKYPVYSEFGLVSYFLCYECMMKQKDQ